MEMIMQSPAELRHYEDSLKAFRDVKNCIDSAEEKGRAEGRAEGLAEGLAKGQAEGRAEGIAIGVDQAKIEIARRMLAKGFSVPDICEATGLSEAVLSSLS